MQFRNFLLSALHEADAAVILPELREVSLRRAQLLYEVGDEIDTVYFPSSACLSVLTVLANGDEVETATVGRESAPALLDCATDKRSEERIVTQISGSALALPASVYRSRLLESRSLMALTLLHIRALARQADIGVGCNATHNVEGRLARWLLMTGDRTGSSSFELTQDYMAIMTGVQRTTVSHVAADFKAGGLIDYTRGKLTILNRPALMRRACGCYAAMAQQFESLRGNVAEQATIPMATHLGRARGYGRELSAS
ncbi:MAG: transcriptional regulator, Crp/Fnr family [Caulobacteraceae bacterium]|jgi:CRP-like cAMP-binding protein|nr:transcriptional regulator, Crp/Fnr family [Caulobacteraceae bacterium]